MAGTVTGGKKAAAKNIANNPNFYSEIGAKGGRNGNTGGFKASVQCECDIYDEPHFIRRCAGYKGGLISRRTKKV